MRIKTMVISIDCVAWLNVFRRRCPKSGLQGTMPRGVGTEVIRL